MSGPGWAIFRPMQIGNVNMQTVALEGLSQYNTLNVATPVGVSTMMLTWDGSGYVRVYIRDHTNAVIYQEDVLQGSIGTQRSAVLNLSAEREGHRVTFYTTAVQRDVDNSRLAVQIIPTLTE